MHDSNHTPSTADPSLLLDIIELKWLYAAHGVRLHVERLQRDPEYARQLLDAAADTSNDALRQVAGRLRTRLSANAG